MKRREFIGLVGGAAAAWPLRALAQAAGSVRKVGVLLSGVESDPDSQLRIAAFRRGGADLGWKEGDSVQIEYRWSAGKSDLIRQYAEELVALKPDVILANSTPVIAMLKSMTNSIPIVFALATDPVGLGHVQEQAAHDLGVGAVGDPDAAADAGHGVRVGPVGDLLAHQLGVGDDDLDVVGIADRRGADGDLLHAARGEGLGRFDPTLSGDSAGERDEQRAGGCEGPET